MTYTKQTDIYRLFTRNDVKDIVIEIICMLFKDEFSDYEYIFELIGRYMFYNPSIFKEIITEVPENHEIMYYDDPNNTYPVRLNNEVITKMYEDMVRPGFQLSQNFIPPSEPCEKLIKHVFLHNLRPYAYLFSWTISKNNTTSTNTNVVVDLSNFLYKHIFTKRFLDIRKGTIFSDNTIFEENEKHILFLHICAYICHLKLSAIVTNVNQINDKFNKLLGENSKIPPFTPPNNIVLLTKQHETIKKIEKKLVNICNSVEKGGPRGRHGLELFPDLDSKSNSFGESLQEYIDLLQYYTTANSLSNTNALLMYAISELSKNPVPKRSPVPKSSPVPKKSPVPKSSLF
jgi:hypothetical protein